MQFHTTESLEVKELTHEAYERIRSRATEPEERPALADFQRRTNMLLAAPPGTTDIADFPIKTEKKDA
jgi:hypothetical protein